jgi:hypothetical protein
MANDKPKQQTEEVILDYPYKVFGHLKVTANKLIFKKYWPGFNTFSGEIDFSDLEEVRFIKRIPVLSVTGLEIIYKLPSGKIKKITINFPSISGRLGMKLHSGATPELLYKTIVSLKENADTNKRRA